MEIWFNPKCSKCRLAKDMLDEAGTPWVARSGDAVQAAIAHKS